MPTLRPILREVGQLFLPWSTANQEALTNKDESFEIELRGKVYKQKPQKYHAKSLKVLKGKFNQMKDGSVLNEILKETGCLRWLT